MKEGELQARIQQLETENNALKQEVKTYHVYKHLFDNSKDLVCIADIGCNFKMVNPSFSELLGYSMQELMKRPYMEFIHPDDREKTAAEAKLNQAGFSTPQFENRYIKKDGQPVTLQWMRSIDPLTQEIYAIARDVTAQRETENKLKQQKELLNASQAVAKLGNFSYNTQDQSLYWSDELYAIFGITEEEKSSLYEAYMARFDGEGFEMFNQLMGEALQSGKKYTFKHKVHVPNGKVKTVSCYGVPFMDDQGTVYRIDGVVQDITDEIENRETILKSMKEKEFLMQELHHRVKNNLQIISSLLNLQTELISDKQGKQQLIESRNRILSIAAVHDMLYNSGNVTTVSFCQYIKELVQDLIDSHSGAEKKPTLVYDADPIHLSLDVAVPLGLIINEVVTNALKYAFNDTAHPTLNVALKNHGSELSLRIRDNGSGFNIQDVDRSKSLGFIVVESLSDQIGGVHAFESDGDGTCYSISGVEIV